MMEDKQKERASEIKAVIKQEIKDMFDFDEQKGPQLTNSFSQVQVQEGKTQDEKLGFGLSLKLNPTTQTTTTTGTKRKPTQFTLELDEENSQVKKRTLIPIVYTVEEMMAIGLTKEEIEKKQKEEKKKQIQDIIDRIPVEKDQLFAYQIPWELVDQVFFSSNFYFQNLFIFFFLFSFLFFSFLFFSFLLNTNKTKKFGIYLGIS